MEDDHGNGSLSVNSFNGSTPTLFGLQYKLSFKPSDKKKAALLLAGKRNPKELYFLSSSIQKSLKQHSL